ncbi:hypothetical protein AYI69_g4559 [Smittium culicis]|uniref:Uncharacterized protein n=1 Tax=Smittium culicis TaxID=133412 RepID=A0A1R1YCL2_9FUNG|nr:hypothetical protein AYI69_g4559 [Smittium culicis]
MFWDTQRDRYQIRKPSRDFHICVTDAIVTRSQQNFCMVYVIRFHGVSFFELILILACYGVHDPKNECEPAKMSIVESLESVKIFGSGASGTNERSFHGTSWLFQNNGFWIPGLFSISVDVYDLIIDRAEFMRSKKTMKQRKNRKKSY